MTGKYGIKIESYGYATAPTGMHDGIYAYPEIVDPLDKIELTQEALDKYLKESHKTWSERVAIDFQKRTLPRFLARCGVPVNWRYVDAMTDEECVRRHKALSDRLIAEDLEGQLPADGETQ